MLSKQRFHVSGGRLAGGIILAIVLGLLTPMLILLEVSLLLPVLMLSGLFMVSLYGFAGRLPALLFMVVQLGMTATALNTTFMWMVIASGVIPAILALRGIIMKQPFFEQMKLNVVAYVVGLVAAIFVAWLTYGGNMIGRAVESLRAQFDLMPDALFVPFVETINQALRSEAVPGMSMITVADYRARFLAMFDLVGETYETMLPGTLISGAALTGVLTTLWGNRQMARRGLATNESYVSLQGWFMPRQLTLILLIMWVAAYILSETAYASGESVYMAAYAVTTMAFTIQGACALDRYMFRVGMQSGRRRFLLGAALALGLVFRLFGTFLLIIGAFSALFGSHGAIARRIEPKDKDHNE